MPGIELVTRIATAVLVFFAGFWFVQLATHKWDHAGLFFVAFCATCGWLYTTHAARHNQIAKNTFDLIYSYIKDSRYVDLRDAVTARFSPYTAIDAAAAEQLVADYFNHALYAGRAGKDFPVAYHLVQLANFYEYLAIGLKADFLSDDLAKQYFGSTLKNFYMTKAQFFIRDMRTRNITGQPPGTKSLAYSELLALLRRWYPAIKLLADRAPLAPPP